MTLKGLAATITHENAHLITLSDTWEKKKEWNNAVIFKALKNGFVENKGQSGTLSAVSKTQGKCQLSVNPIQTLLCNKSEETYTMKYA